ncbi:hypothetical protein V1478_002197 [Vespula squamosa]|uniref:Uncharacterized protein n=1 Tax=Vespula squamosa TaxID=30214 RepID=A0ABD2BW93_VESSQ
MLRSSKSCIPHFVFLKAASRVLRRLFAEIERRTDPVTIQINQRNSIKDAISITIINFSNAKESETFFHLKKNELQCDCNKDTKIFQISLIGV